MQLILYGKLKNTIHEKFLLTSSHLQLCSILAEVQHQLFLNIVSRTVPRGINWLLDGPPLG